MDGATGLGGPESIYGLTPAEWYVQMVSKFLERSIQNKDRDIKEIIRDAVCYVTKVIRQYETEHNMKFKSYEEPSATLLVYRDIEKDKSRWIQIYALRGF